MKNKIMSDDIIHQAVKIYWHKTHIQDVIVYFYQKYENEQKWHFVTVLARWFSPIDYNSVEFDWDFCEGETEVKDVLIVPFDKVTDFYYNELFELEAR